MKTLARFWQVLMVISNSTSLLKWFFNFAAVFMTAAALLHIVELWPGFSMALAGLGVSCLVLWATFVLLTSPLQLLSLISSKPIGLFSGVKGYGFTAIFFISLCMASLSLIFLLAPAFKFQSAPGQFFLVALLTISLYFVFTVWLSHKIPAAAAWMSCMYFLLVFAFGWLLRQPSEMLMLSIVVIWVVFGGWWFRLRPQKHFQNTMQSQFPDATGTWLYDFFTSKNTAIKNLQRSSLFEMRLFGSQLNGGAILQRSALTLLALIALMFACKFKLVSPPLDLIYFMVGVILPQTMVFSSGSNVHIQLKKTWLLMAGSRRELLRLIENRLYQQLAILGMAYVGAVFLSVYFYNPLTYGVVFMLIMMTLTFSLLAAAFYAGLLTYLKKQASIRWNGYVSVVFSLLLSLVFFVVGETRSELNALLVTVAGLVLAYCLRLWVLRLWPRVNLLQGKV